MTKRIFIFFFIPFIIVLSTTAHAKTYYISMTGDDYDDGLSQSSAFKTMKKAAGVAGGGDVIKICPGSYLDTEIGRFWKFQGFSSDSRVKVRAVQDGSSWPVRIRGSIYLEGGYADIRNIKFFKGGVEFDSPGLAIIAVQGHTIRIVNCLIQGDSADVDLEDLPQKSYDGIKILSKENYNSSIQNHDIIIRGCEIVACPENAIDITGARDCAIRDNDIHYSGSIQVKGGTLNCLIERNKIYGMKYGIISGSMWHASEYVGSPVLPTLPLSERYNGKNIVVRNNLLYAIRGQALNISWENSRIFNNTIAKANKLSQVVKLVDHSIKYYDAEAKNSGAGVIDGDGVRIYKGPKNITFKNNILFNVNTSRNAVYATKSAWMSGWNASHNLYYGHGGGLPQFRVGDSFYYGVQDFSNAGYEDITSMTYENEYPGFKSPRTMDYSLTNDAYVIDMGYDFGFSLDDIKKNRRKLPNDIGAYERGSIK